MSSQALPGPCLDTLPPRAAPTLPLSVLLKHSSDGVTPYYISTSPRFLLEEATHFTGQAMVSWPGTAVWEGETVSDTQSLGPKSNQISATC